jgi:hypothetical protein
MKKIILSSLLISLISSQIVQAFDYKTLAYSLSGIGAASLLGAYYYSTPCITQDDRDYIADYKTYMQMHSFIHVDLMGNMNVNPKHVRDLGLISRSNQTNNWLITQAKRSVKKLKKISAKDREDLSEKIAVLGEHASPDNCNCGSFTIACMQRNANAQALAVISKVQELSKICQDAQAKLAQECAKKTKEKYRFCLLTGISAVIAGGISWLISRK